MKSITLFVFSSIGLLVLIFQPRLIWEKIEEEMKKKKL